MGHRMVASRVAFPSETFRSQAIQIELFYAPGCPHCARARQLLQAWLREHDDRIRLQETNVLDALERAVALGVRRTPTMVIDGVVVFTGPPTKAELQAELRRRLD